MLFNSYAFIFIFLPITLVGYYGLTALGKIKSAKWWLFSASLYFYTFWTFKNLPILLLSIAFNYTLGNYLISQLNEHKKKNALYLGLAFNICLLSFFKYSDQLPFNLNIFLPLGISFFTIQQIAFIVDSYQGASEKRSFIDYALFVSLFTHITAGPITTAQALIPQLEATENKKFNFDKFSLGIFIFCVGLFKKVIIADTFATWANEGFSQSANLEFFGAWKTSLSYSFQLYYDFCGYSEMAMGIGALFNLNLPQNFNSPFKSKNVIEFWAKWHATLGKFITTYIFTPIVRQMPSMSFWYIMLSTFLAMVIVGIWHGAGWTFAIYGALHGLALVLNHIWKKRKKKLPPFLAWFLTFNFVNFAFVIFRAANLQEAKHIYKAMMGLQGVTFPKIIIKSVGPLQNYGWKMGTYLKPEDYAVLLMTLGAFLVVKYTRNLVEQIKEFEAQPKYALFSAALFVISLFGLNRVTEFIYLKF